MPTTPKLSIGLPVYNGERYLALAIESILGQTFADFELIICDNASTDGTADICLRYAKQDSRIRYHRNAENLGAAGNFNHAFGLAQGKYFKWAAHDDLLAPDFLARCIDVLDHDDSVVLCHSEVQFIDGDGQHMTNPKNSLPDASSFESHIRFAQLMNMNHWCLDIFGVIRTEALERSPLIGSYVGSDRNTLVCLGLMGRFHRVPARLFFTRDHSERSVRKIPPKARAAWFNPKLRRLSFLHWRILSEYGKTLLRVPLAPKQKLLCGIQLLRWLRRNRWRLEQEAKSAFRKTKNF